MNARFAVVMMVMVALAVIAFPAAATISKVPAGGEIFLGEKNLDVTAAVGGATQIAWWQPGTNTETEQPADIQQVTNAQSFYVSPDIFVGKTGNWYQWNGSVKSSLAFNIKEPSLNLKVWDGTTNKDVSGKAIPVGNYGNFVVETNMQSIITRPGYTPADAPFKIKVKSADGGVYTSLVGNNGKDISLVLLGVNQQLWYWVGTDDTHTAPAANDGWNTAAEDKYGNRMYKAGTYTVWTECNANGMKDMYKAPDGSDYTGKTISAVKSVDIATDQVKIEANKDTVVRGNPFSVTITGVPNAGYYVWVKGTGSMTGLPDDQPPMILDTQVDVAQDPAAGPYDIGKYQYEGGAGKSIKQDVPDDPDYHGTKFYALVKLNDSGTRTVEWKTSKDTKDKKYTIRVERKSGTQYKSDEVDIKVEKGDVTIVASGDQSYYLGEEVKLSGTNSETDLTYLYITGPNLPTAGGMLKSPHKEVINEQAASFDQADVQDDDTWEFKWQTANLEMDAGTYTVYAVSAPRDANHLSDAQYDTVSLVIKKPYIQATASASVVAKGDKLYVRGTAEGDPSQGVAIWILGKNKVLYATESVNDDMSFEHEITGSETESLYAGQYFVVVQHPMYNNEFDVYPDNALEPQKVLGAYPTRDSELFRIGGSGSLQGTDAADALVKAIDSAMVDDIYTKLQFLVEEPKVTINPIGEQAVGSKFEIAGTTNLAYDDNDLQVEVTSSSFKPTDKSQSGEFSGASGTVQVQQGTDGLNKWSFTVDASTFKPDEYIVRVSGVTTDVVETALFNIVEAGEVSPVEQAATKVADEVTEVAAAANVEPVNDSNVSEAVSTAVAEVKEDVNATVSNVTETVNETASAVVAEAANKTA